VPASDAAASPRRATAQPAGLLIEAAWCYRFPARVSRDLLLRQERQPKLIREIAWKAPLGLCARYRQLARSGKPANVVVTAGRVTRPAVYSVYFRLLRGRRSRTRPGRWCPIVVINRHADASGE
jgi:hypothetical protein